MPTTPKVLPTFDVDKKGLAKTLARKGKAFALVELIQNAWDENTKNVHVTLEAIKGGKYRLTVEDDNPEGFADLSHAYTLFAESAKKSQAEKRGRFNLGEKLVIAVCEEASISTTKGTVVFTDKGRVHLPKKRDAGSVFIGTLRMTQAEAEEVQALVFTLIPPHGITTTFNMNEVPERKPVMVFETKLRTERADDDGNLKPTTRKCKVEVYEPLTDEEATIYEMGIPVVATGDRFHVNVTQKIPLNMDRDNVPPAYLRDLRVAVLNAAHGLMGATDLKAGWVTQALEDENADPQAVEAVIKGRFGDKVVIADPTDPEANKIAVEKGYTVIPGGALPKPVWGHVKGHSIALPAGQVTPSPKVDQNADLPLMNPDHYPADMQRVVEFTVALAKRLLGVDVNVRVTKSNKHEATYKRIDAATGEFTYYVGCLGFKWFRRENVVSQIDLMLHEFGHHFCDDHLDRKYLDALTMLGARSTLLAMEEPEFFRSLAYEEVAA